MSSNHIQMSSLSFIGNATSYLRIPNVADLNFGTGDFTIEWYQYQTDSNSFPRIFQIGKYSVGAGISIGVSLEGGTLETVETVLLTTVLPNVPEKLGAINNNKLFVKDG